LLTVTLSGAFLEYRSVRFSDRSFFGTHLVRDLPAPYDMRYYFNGTTLHGMQRHQDMASSRPEPLSYYHRDLPMARVLQSRVARSASDIGIVGLGIGSLACYRQPDQNYHFYEIDHLVDQIARDPDLFSYMTACAKDQPTYLGDARIVLDTQDNLKMSVLIIDAYSSDAVPVHLTTTEAMQLYLKRVHPEGVLLYHISNRCYDIHVPLARSAEALGVNIWMNNMPVTEELLDDGAFQSTVVMIARPGADTEDILADENWRPLNSDGGRLWTDDYANPLSILRL